ncbi:1-deoxy-D-xylulose-5-phosphate synthase [bacterium]|nr:1-deoxy-D-xylulose-5-phosphate synthase [bacterium]
MQKLLDKIQYPEDLKKLNIEQLPQLAEEIRTFLVEQVSKTGGHLAPNLGVVELTLALHYVFDMPKDKIVWDVGHQAYVHKILTGRKDRFHTLRQYGGISGFPKISESEYDVFGVGHASTSISAAYGMAVARDLNQDDFSVVAVIGDGAMTGGLALEGLNNAGGSRRDFIVILNDNRMSISPNVGALSKALTQVITTSLYNRVKEDIWELTGRLPRGARTLRKIIQRIEEALKMMLIPGQFFERMGFRYFGPVSGHNIDRMIRIFREIKKLHGPILVHLHSVKGKGYKFAEEDATKFHGLGSFCPETGNAKPRKAPPYNEIFGTALVELAEKDEKIIGITAAMAHGTGLIHLQKRFPQRFFDVGIAEQHAVTFAAGMALQGLKPVVAIYSTFLQRAYDQLIHDVGLQKLPIVFVLDRGGLVGEDGPTHHGSFDLSYLRIIPNFVIMAPRDENELRDMLYTALNYEDGPVAIRYPRGESLGLPRKPKLEMIPIGKSIVERTGKHVAILAAGDRVVPVLDVASQLEKRKIMAEVVNVRFIKPLDRVMLENITRRFKHVVTVENNCMIGGMGSAVAEWMAEAQVTDVTLHRFGLKDEFIPHGSLCDLWDYVGFSTHLLTNAIEKCVKKK